MRRLTAETLTNAQIRAYGDLANANGDTVALMRAHRALAVPPVSWDAAWNDRAEARCFIAYHINLADGPYIACADAKAPNEIADEQILRLYAETTANDSQTTRSIARDCLVALGMGDYVYPEPQTRAARRRCAEFLNTHKKAAS